MGLTVSFTTNALRSDRGRYDSASHNCPRKTPIIGTIAHINVISFFISDKKLMLLDLPIREKHAQSQADSSEGGKDTVRSKQNTKIDNKMLHWPRAKDTSIKLIGDF